MTAVRYGDIWPRYAKEWDVMQVKPQFFQELAQLAKYAINNKPIYMDVAEKGLKGDPKQTWPLIAVIHRREGDANFGTYLGNGQSLHMRTTIVPRGRGPFSTFLAGCLDALRIDGLSFVLDWRLEKMLYYCESFNGWGYWLYHGHMPSPYNWGMTTVQVRGKYSSDGHWDPGLWDPQPGCAAILWMISHLDPSVQYVRES